MRGCRSVEVDVWDGEPDTPDTSDAEASSDSSSDSDSEDGNSLGKKLRSKIKSKTEKSKAESQDQSAKGQPRSISAKLGDALRRKSTKSTSAKATSATPGKEASPSQTLVKGEPRVLHGHTLTKGTPFREVCYAIRDSAFVASDLPLVVSLEVHACLEQQQMMVDVIREAWEGLLVEVPADTDPEKLPTLAELRRKILVKAKAVPLKGAEDVTEEQVSPQPTNGSGEKTAEEQPQKPAKPSKVLEALAKLAVYTRAYHFNHFDQPGMN